MWVWHEPKLLKVQDGNTPTKFLVNHFPQLGTDCIPGTWFQAWFESGQSDLKPQLAPRKTIAQKPSPLVSSLAWFDIADLV